MLVLLLSSTSSLLVVVFVEVEALEHVCIVPFVDKIQR